MTVARLTDRLAARHLVERKADPRDRRIWRLHLTDAANPLLDEIRTQRDAVAAMVARDLPETTVDAMVDGLLRMKATLLTDCRCTQNSATEPVVNPASAEQEMV